MKNILLKSHADAGLLLLRVGIGIMFILHGYPKIMGGMNTWTGLGGSMGHLGISFAPAFWGFMAAVSECLGGAFLVLGLFTKPASLLMAFTMIVATVHHLAMGDPFMRVASRPFELMFIFLALIFLGAGRFSLDKILFGKDSN